MNNLVTMSPLSSKILVSKHYISIKETKILYRNNDSRSGICKMNQMTQKLTQIESYIQKMWKSMQPK